MVTAGKALVHNALVGYLAGYAMPSQCAGELASVGYGLEALALILGSHGHNPSMEARAGERCPLPILD